MLGFVGPIDSDREIQKQGEPVMTVSRKIILPVAGAALAMLAAAPASAQQAIRLGTSSVGSSFYVVTVGMSKIIQKHAGMNVSVEPLGGSHANIFGLGRKKVDFAVANSGATFDGYNGNAPFKKPQEIRIVLQGQPSFRHIFLRKGSGIKSAKDLAGKVFLAKRKPLPELEKLAVAWIEAGGGDKSKVKLVSSRNLGEMNRVLRAGSVDLATFPFGLRQPVATKLFNDDVIEPVILSDKEYDAIMKKLPPMFYEYTVKANHFKNQPKAFKTFGLVTQLATHAGMDDETVYKIAKAVLSNNKEFATFHGSARAWTAKRTVNDAKIPIHNGTIRYLKEAGLWTAAHEAQQKKLLARK